MPKASRVLAALKRDGWVEVRRKGSHRTLKKGSETARWAFHDSVDLGNIQMRQAAEQFGYTLEALRKLVEEDNKGMTVRLMVFHDQESNNWGFRVPALHIVGGGCNTREEAKQHALDAIAFALEDVEEENPDENVEVIDLAVELVG